MIPVNNSLYIVAAMMGRRRRVHIVSRDTGQTASCPFNFSSARSALHCHVTDGDTLALVTPQQLVFVPLESLFGDAPRFRQLTISGGVKATHFVKPRFVAVVRSNRVEFIDADGLSPPWETHLHDHV